MAGLFPRCSRRLANEPIVGTRISHRKVPDVNVLYHAQISIPGKDISGRAFTSGRVILMWRRTKEHYGKSTVRR
jgi:hypothetical protein